MKEIRDKVSKRLEKIRHNVFDIYLQINGFESTKYTKMKYKSRGYALLGFAAELTTIVMAKHAEIVWGNESFEQLAVLIIGLGITGLFIIPILRDSRFSRSIDRMKSRFCNNLRKLLKY